MSSMGYAMRLVECVPNFSEGRDPAVIKQITDVIESVEGVRLSQQGYADDIAEEGFAPLKDLMANFVKAGGKIWVCSPCFKRRKLDEAKLVAAAKACGFRGERRALRVPLTDLEWSLRGDILTLCFSLPPGAYATSVLRELMKTPPANA